MIEGFVVDDQLRRGREFNRLGFWIAAVFLSVVTLNLIRFGDLSSLRDCLALKQFSCAAIRSKNAEGTSQEVRTDTIQFRNLTFRTVRVFGLLNSCGPILGHDDVTIPPFGQVNLTAWEKSTIRSPVYRIHHGLDSKALDVRVTR